jgi:mannosyltransferase
MFNFLANNTPYLYLTQSLWRDEAFSVLIAEHAPTDIVRLTAADFNPPLYYLILHYWMMFFGSSEIAVRLLSFFFHVLLIFVVYHLGKYVFRGMPLFSLILMPLFVAINPLLLYYAFEARMYSLLALLATTSMYFFIKKQWRWYVAVSILGLYTHLYVTFIFIAQTTYALWSSGRVKNPIKDIRRSRSFFFALTGTALAFLPWLPVLFDQIQRSKESWIYPINVEVGKALLGNLYTGFEGNPPFFWQYSAIISLIIITASLHVMVKKPNNTTTPLIFLFWLFVPTALVFTISIYKPLYANRYLIFSAVAEVCILALSVAYVSNEKLQRLYCGVVLVGTVAFQSWYAPYHRKVDFRTTIHVIEENMTKQDILLAENPLSFFELMYYADDRSRVYLYNPARAPLPAYVGPVLIPQETWRGAPPVDGRGFLIDHYGSFPEITQGITYFFMMRQQLPSRVPLYYSLPWGAERLADTPTLLLLPIGALLITMLNSSIALVFYKREMVLGRMLMIVSSLSTVLLLYTFFRIIMLITGF